MADLINIGFRVSGGDKAAEDVKKITEETKKLGEENKKTETAVKSYSAQIKALRLQLISLGERTKENAQQYDNLSESIRTLDDAQEDLLIGTGQLDDQLSALPGPVGNLASSFKSFDIALKNVRGAKIALIKQFPILKNAIAATGIGALVIVFGLLVGAVVKAFNSFKPLQDAVGRLGVAFELVEKLVQPVIDLVGRGLTVAVDGAAKAIAFLTGSLDEYNKEVSDAAATAKLKSNLEQQKALFELNKDAFTQFERDKRQAYQDNLERFREIDEQEGLSNQEKNERKKASNALYYRDLQRAEKAEQDRKEENFKKEQERQKVLRQLTKEQITQLNNLTNVSLKNLQSRFDILKARQVEALGNPENIESIRKATDFWNKALQTTTTEVKLLENQLKFLGGSIPDVAFEPLMTSMDQLQTNIGKTGDELDIEFKKIMDALKEKPGQENFISAVEGPLGIVVDDFKNIGKILKEAGIEGKESIEPLINSIKEFEKASLRGTLEDREKANVDFLKQQEVFVKKFTEKQTDLIKEQFKKANNITGEFTKEQEEQFQQQTGNITNLATAAFETIRENLRVAEAFRKEAKDINDIITQQIVPSIKKAVEEGGFDKVIRDNIDLYSTLVENIVENSGAIDNSVQNLGGSIDTIKRAFAGLNQNLVITSETAVLLIDNLVKRRGEVDTILKKFDTEYLGSNYDQQLQQLENQRLADMELLKNKKATIEQLTQLDEMYNKRRKQLEADYTIYTMDASAQIFGNLASLFGEHTTAFKGLKFFEAIITAISSSVKAYESALEYGGPAGPIIAPILAATTFAAQQRQAMKILQSPEPSPGRFSGGGAGPSGGLFGRDGGLVYGRTHEQGGVPAELEGGEFIINRRSMMMPGVLEIARQLNEMNPNTGQAQQMPVKAYVISGEMTTAQRADKRIRDLSRL